MKHRRFARFLSALLVVCLVLSMAPTAILATQATPDAWFEEISADEVSAGLRMDGQTLNLEEEETPDPEEIVRVSIVLEKAPVLDRGYSTMGLAANGAAQAYRQDLLADQQAVTARISTAIGQELDVAWNLTLAGNIISANVRYGDLEKIAATRGVAEVVLETQYAPYQTEEGTAQPNNGTATVMTGASTVWSSGYTGAGSRVAIIDTGLDTDHEAVDNGAYLYALAENAGAAGMTTEEYIASLNPLDAEEIAAVLPQLNIAKGWLDYQGNPKPGQAVTAQELHLSDKIPFAYNYIDQDLDVTHDNDNQGGHGSHVAGIAAANRYVPEGDGYVSAMESTFMVGAAPDAQLIVMKVFGKNGGAYDSDYMAAIEDAILLNCDVVNLSLGSGTPGFTTSDLYQDSLDKLAQSGTVVSMSAGNSGAWAQESYNGGLYAEDVNYHTGGSPGTYQNAFTVASVENAGMTGYSFQVAGRDVVYTETLYYNAALTTLDTTGSGTAYPYVFLDSLGYPEDYDGIDVNGKVVFVSRGVSSFSEKLTSAANAGAIACIIYNNEPGGAINMDLSQSYAEIPCVGITMADAGAIRAASQPVADSENNPLYYTGTLSIGQKMGTSVEISEDCVYTMSDFSSWGVPGDLSLKPEITAPGGNINSIDGATAKTDQYTVMSGTSMASPHNAGLVALLYQYFRETGLPEELGVSPRVLAQSLLMSTATPIVDGSTGLPYPVIQQGAGLGNVNDALNASAYVMVENQPDGKVKAELGDDPDRTGVYTFDYTLFNLEDEAWQYTLSADVFTQAYGQDYLEEYGEEEWYARYTLTKLAALTAFAVDGKEILPEAGQLDGCDYNGDGKINQGDGQALLDYAVGKLDTLTNLDKADLNGDGNITAYDAELFLTRLGKYVVELPANGQVTVTVTITLPDSVKEELDRVFVNGAYIEAYVYATPFATAEGVVDPTLSIPVLAFYGGWDEAPMFDRANYTEVSAGTNDRVSYIDGTNAYNFVAAAQGEDVYYLGGNPYATDDEYLPERNAISSNAEVGVTALSFCLIRAAGGLRSAITDVDTGEVYAYEAFDHVYPAYFFTNYGQWTNYNQSVVPGTAEGESWRITDAEGNPLPEGTRVELMVQAAPEYYLENDSTINWDEIDPDNSTLSLQLTVDNTAPELKQVSVGTETDPATGEPYSYVEAVVQDNRYVAAVILMTPGGTKVVARQPVNQTVQGIESQVRLDITGVYGSTFKLAVVDYAGNATYYDVNVTEPFSGPTATLLGSSMDFGGAQWRRFTSDANYDYEPVYSTELTISGAAYGDGYLFFSSNLDEGSTSTPYLFVVDYPSFENPIAIGKVSGNEWFDSTVNNLCYNTDDQSLYFVRGNKLVHVDVTDASQTDLGSFYMETELMLSGLDYSETEHCFYVIGAEYYYDFDAGQLACPAGLYRFTPPESEETISLTKVADFGVWATTGAHLALDEEQNAAYILRNGNLEADLFTYEFGSNTLTQTGKMQTCGNLLLIDESTADDNSIFSDEPGFVSLSTEVLNVFAGGQKQLTAEVGPWTLKDKTIVWTSSDPAVAAVNENGLVMGIQEGTATITAASKQDETIKAECSVTVIGSNFTMQGIGTNGEGESVLFTYNPNTNAVTNQIPVTNEAGEALPVESATAGTKGTLWVQDRIVDADGKGYRLYNIDPATGKATLTTGTNTNNYGMSSLLFSDLAVDDWQNLLMGVNGDKVLFFSENPGSNDLGSSWFSNSSVSSYVGLSTGETWSFGGFDYTMFYALDAAGRIIANELTYSPFFASWTTYMTYYDMDRELTFTADENGVYQDSLIYNEESGALLLFHYTGANSTEIYAIDLIDPDGPDSAEANGTANLIPLGEIKDFQDVSIYSATYTGLAAAQETQVPAADAQREQICLTIPEKTVPMGSTNVAAEAPAKAEDGMVTVTLRAEEAAASGMVEIDLGENLTLVSLESPAALSSYKEQNGKVVFGYAGTEPVAQGEVIATLQLRLNADQATVTLTETERGGQAMDLQSTVTVRNTCDGGDGCPSTAFSDLDTEKWYHEYVDFVLEQGLMNGMGDGIFAPNTATTRGMMVTVLYRMAGEPEVESLAPFTDVAEGQYFAKAVAWAYENGITLGVTETRFAPSAAATREQIATFLYRYAQVAGLEVSARGELTAFPDGSAVSSYAKEAVSWAVGTGLLVGNDKGQLTPKADATRAQLAAMLCRLITA